MLREAVATFAGAAKEMPRNRLPLNWARIKFNTANALLRLGTLERSDVRLLESIENYRLALLEMYLERDPNAWAMVEENLGRALRARTDLKPSATALSDAIVHEEQFHNGAAALLWASENADEQPIWAERITSSASRLTSLLLMAGRVAEAFSSAQRGSAVQLGVSLSMTGAAAGERADAIRLLRRRWRSACDAANHLDGELLGADGGPDLRRVLDRREAAQRIVVARFRALRRAIQGAGLPFPEPPTCGELHRELPVGGALVLLVAVSDGLVAFAVAEGGTADGVECTRLSGFSAHDLERLVGTRGPSRSQTGAAEPSRLASYARFRNAVDGDGCVAPPDIATWNAAIGRISERLWESVMGPLDVFLRTVPGVFAGSELVLVPVGLMSLLPLHAARRVRGEGRRYFIQDWIVSYGPTPGAWLASRRQGREAPRQGRRLLAVTPAGLNPAMAAFEGEARHELSGRSATPRAVRDALPSANYVSFYCHGSWNAADPLKSILHLHGPSAFGGVRDVPGVATGITVHEMREVGLESSRLVMLLACESGMVGLRHSHEAVGFPTALIDSGVPGVLASLWMVEQGATRKLAESMLSIHLHPTLSLSPAAALRHAQLAMLGYDEGRHGDVAVTDGPGAAGGRVQLAGGIGGFPGSGAPTASPIGLSRSEPYYWAAFTLTGT